MSIEELDLLWMHCKEDSKLLRYILKDYMFLRQQNYKLQVEIEMQSVQNRKILHALSQERIVDK